MCASPSHELVSGTLIHATVLLIPVYKQKLKNEKPLKRTINVWSQKGSDELQDCFATTNWDIFKADNDLHAFTETVSAYIKFCSDICLPCKTVTRYPNNKPWCDKVIKSKIKAKVEAYRHKVTDPECYRHAKSDLRKAIKNAKRTNRAKLSDYKSKSGMGQYKGNYSLPWGKENTKHRRHFFA